ncbi:MAG: Gfo/Idh/MocA family oxidoreductase [Defluviitaleaceae bacterium]|nr:Gfo/Idh/MocA family oxidoreductase [Defluviitaleaceae bacterium]
MKTKIGIVGCGAISGIYLTNITNMFKELEIAGVCDLIDERADKVVAEYGLRKYKDMHEMFADPEVDIVLNITRPYEHLEVSMAAIAAGKHVYTEKPLGATYEEGKKIKEAAATKGVKLGGAPDTFLGAGIQTCRKLIDDGYIGEPVGATAFMTCRGHESWHPDPAFYYQFGGGPMMDMGPYYITALVNLLGPIKTVSGLAKASFPARTITSEPHFGTVVDVEVPTNIMGQLQFASGAMGSIYTSFDVHAANLPIIEIYGSEGTLSVPDPNTFGGPIKLFRPEHGGFMEFPLTFGYPDNSRGLGLADMAKAIQTSRAHRASDDLTFHVLEVMTSIERSAKENSILEIKAPYQRTAPMVNMTLPGVLD